MFEGIGKYFMGNEVSEYGRKNGFVDYATFAKAFSHISAPSDFVEAFFDSGDALPYSGDFEDIENVCS